MNILHISTSDLAHGAGLAAYHLHSALNQIGQTSKMLVALKLSDEPQIYSLKSSPKNFREKLIHRGQSFLESSLNQFAPQSIYASISSDLTDHPLVKEADIINLHNLHWHSNNFSLFLLKNLSKSKPIVWTFHDMWAFTGHCIYSLDCERWQVGCGKCPDLAMTISLKLDTTALLFKIKKYLYQRSNFTIITPSEWLKKIAALSPLLENRKIVCINNGINQDLYQAIPKSQARQALGIPENVPVVLFGSAHWSAAFKGYAYFEKALLKIKDELPDVYLLGFGNGQFSESLEKQFKSLAFGYINHGKIKSLIYSAADLFIFPTMAEAFGNVAIESMICGTPIVGFKTGGVADTVVHLETGYLAEPGNVEDLAQGILTLLNNAQLRENLAKNGIERVKNNFTSLIQAQHYLKIYQEEIETFLDQSALQPVI